MDYNSLPPEFQDRLTELEQEFREGELTKKGFEKKKNSLFEEYRRQYIGDGGEHNVGSAHINDKLGELSLSTSPIVSTSLSDGGVSPTNSINNGNYYIQQDGGYSTNQYNSNQQQYGGYSSHSVHHSLQSHTANLPPHHHNAFLQHHQPPTRTLSSDLSNRVESVQVTHRRPDSAQMNPSSTSTSPNMPPLNPNSNNQQIPTMNYRPPHLAHHSFAPFGTASRPIQPSGRPPLPPPGYHHHTGPLQYFPPNTSGYPVRPNRPIVPPIRPAPPSYGGEIPSGAAPRRAKQLVNEERARNIIGGRSSLDISDSASIKGYTRSTGEHEYLRK